MVESQRSCFVPFYLNLGVNTNQEPLIKIYLYCEGFTITIKHENLVLMTHLGHCSAHPQCSFFASIGADAYKSGTVY